MSHYNKAAWLRNHIYHRSCETVAKAERANVYTYRIDYGDTCGVNELKFISYTAAEKCFNILQFADGIDSITFWQVSETEDAKILKEWKPRT